MRHDENVCTGFTSVGWYIRSRKSKFNCAISTTTATEKNEASGHFSHRVIIIYPLTARVVGAPQMISQPVSSILPCSPRHPWTWRTPGLSIPWCCLPTSSSVCLFFFPLSLCPARWFWRDLMNGRHVHTQSIVINRRSKNQTDMLKTFGMDIRKIIYKFPTKKKGGDLWRVIGNRMPVRRNQRERGGQPFHWN